jgi:hypothetical protein
VVDEQGVGRGELGQDGTDEEAVAAAQVGDPCRPRDEPAGHPQHDPHLLVAQGDRTPPLIEEPSGDLGVLSARSRDLRHRQPPQPARNLSM